jgi:hypothetical protein
MYCRDILVFYVHRRFQTVNLGKLAKPYEVLRLPVTVNAIEKIHRAKVDFSYSLNIGDIQRFDIKSVVVVELAPHDSQMIIGCSSLIRGSNQIDADVVLYYNPLDLNQTDIVNNNGLADLINRLKLYQRNIDHNITETINIVEFQKMDIERSDVVKKIIDIYDFNYIKKSNETKSVTMPLLQETNNFRDTTITSNNTCNIVSANNSTIIKSNKYNVISNDAALIPKHHITKNRDIFFDNSLM